MAEVCLVGLFRREYRKLASAIPAGFEARGVSGELSETVARAEKRENGRLSKSSTSNRVAPVSAPVSGAADSGHRDVPTRGAWVYNLEREEMPMSQRAARKYPEEV